MKNILVPTDFSENADKALNFALALARRFNAAIHIVHTYHTSRQAGHLANVNRHIRKDREEEMEAFLTKLRKNPAAESISIEGRARYGFAVETINNEAHGVQADLIIMGTLGASNIAKKVLGSTASQIIKGADYPVLAIPANVQFDDIKRAILAIDNLDIAVLNTLNPVLSLVQRGNLELDLLHVSKSDQASHIDEGVPPYLDSMSIRHKTHVIVSDDVLNSILDFSRQYPNSILCLVTRQRSWLANLFHQSVSRQAALHANIPVFILPDRKG